MKDLTLEDLKPLLEDLAANVVTPIDEIPRGKGTTMEIVKAARYDDLMTLYKKATRPPTPDEALDKFCRGSGATVNAAYLRNTAKSLRCTSWHLSIPLLDALADHLEATGAGGGA